MPEPFEITAGPVDVYIAPVGEAMPLVTDEPPAGNWTLIGTSGSTNIGEDGVNVQHSESVEDFRSLGSTGPVKAFRTEEDLLVSFNLMDLTLEQYTYALNFNTVSVDSNDKTINPYKGETVQYRALLVRGNGKSPYGDTRNFQYEIPRVRGDSAPEVIFVKGEPAGLALQFRAMIDLNAASDADRFGKLRFQALG